jgi:hypothetical protein
VRSPGTRSIFTIADARGPASCGSGWRTVLVLSNTDRWTAPFPHIISHGPSLRKERVGVWWCPGVGLDAVLFARSRQSSSFRRAAKGGEREGRGGREERRKREAVRPWRAVEQSKAEAMPGCGGTVASKVGRRRGLL